MIDFNPEQLDAVQHLEGPILVLAGAGTGKTTVLTGRTLRLVEHGVAPGRILNVTFTRKAADEMRTRLRRLAGETADRMQIGTFHALSGRLLRRNPGLAGLRSDFTVLDEQACRALAAEALAACGFEAPGRELVIDVARRLARIKEQGFRPEQAAAAGQIQSDSDHEIEAGLLERLALDYQARLRAANAADFADLLLWPLLALEADPDYRAKIRKKIEFVQVDEYQDVSPLQDRWIELLCGQVDGEVPNLLAVGDDGQAIYGFRGSASARILDFPDRYANCRVVRLDRNYRSSPVILRAATALIAGNGSRYDKSLRADGWDGSAPPLIQVVAVRDAEAEAEWIGTAVKALPEEISVFVLYRNNWQSREIEEAMITAGVRFSLSGAVPFYRRQEVADALAYLAAMDGVGDAEAFERLVERPARGLGPRTIEAILAEGGEPIDAAARLVASGQLKGRRAAAVGELVALRDRWRASARMSLGERLRSLLSDGGYLALLLADDEGTERLGNIDELARLADALPDLPALLARAAAGSIADDESAAVRLMTVHRSKGLEADQVYLAGWCEGLLPGERALEAPGLMNEERNLAYVALTRARRQAAICHYPFKGIKELGGASRFIGELPEDALVRLTGRAGSGRHGKASEKQIRFMRRVARDLRLETVDEADGQAVARFLDEHADRWRRRSQSHG